MYYFFLGTMQLPVPPAKMSVKINGKNKTINLINEGEASIIKTRMLKEVSFSIRLPNSKYPWANYNNSLQDAAISYAAGSIGGIIGSVLGNSFSFRNAKYFLDQIETLKTSKIPTRFIVSRMTGGGFQMLFSTNILVTVEDYSIEEDAAREGTDVLVPIKLKEYRSFETKTATIQTDKDGNKKLVVNQQRPSIDKSIPNAIKVTRDMTIWEACRQAAGGTLDWRNVMNENVIDNPFEKLKGRILRL